MLIVPNLPKTNQRNNNRNISPGDPSGFRASSAAGNPLGTYAQSSSTREELRNSNPRDNAKRARLRWQRRAQQLLPSERNHVFGQCGHVPLPEARFIVGRYDPAGETSTYKGYIRCDSYQCPCCAYGRSEQDRHELSIALAQARKMDLFGVMITVTVRHHASDILAELREGLSEAFNSTFSGRWYNDLAAELGIKGKVKAWEATFGKNGWHPHLHVLMFLELELHGKFLDEFKSRLTERWLAKLAALGFDATWEHGLSVDTADSAIAEYIAKYGREPVDKDWGADAEMAKAPVKQADRDGLTPFEVLAAAAGDSEPLERLAAIYPADDRKKLIERAEALYREYFHAFKGKPRLYWGKLKEVLELDEALAEYAAANPVESEAVDMVLIDAQSDAHKKLLALPDGQADLLEVIRTGDVFKVMKWLADRKIDAIIPDTAIEACVSGYSKAPG